MKPPPHPKFNHRSLHLLESLFNNVPSISSSSPLTLASKFKQIHAQFITSGLSLHTYPLSRLLHFSSLPPLSSSLSLPYSFSLLLSRSRHLRSPSVFLFNTLLSSLASHSHTHLSLSLYKRLLLSSSSSSCSNPNPFTYPSLLKACAGSHLWAPHGFCLHAHIIVFGFLRDPFLLSALLSFYSKCGDLPACRHLFDRIPDPDLPTWNSVLSAHSSNCRWVGPTSTVEEEEEEEAAFVLFRRMLLQWKWRDPLVKPNEITLVAVISFCGDLGALAQGIWAHTFIVRNGDISINRFLGTALVEMYSKCGRLDLAEQVFDALEQRDTMCYNAMMKGFGIHGYGRIAIDLFDRMGVEGVKVDDVTMVIVINACAHAGLVSEGREFFDGMKRHFRIEPKEEHYGCLVDLFCRAGMIDEARNTVMVMPFKPNAAMYRSLLGACKIQENLELSESLIAQLMQSDPNHGGNYVLQSNFYANVNRWDDVGRVRKVMKDSCVSKTPGLSLIEMDGVMHEFVLGDKTHPQSGQIYAMLDEISRRLNEYGHRLTTKEVLFDV